MALELKEKALENQLGAALVLGGSQEIESIKALLLSVGEETSLLDAKFAEPERGLGEVERNFELLLLKEERDIEDFVRQEELAPQESGV